MKIATIIKPAQPPVRDGCNITYGSPELYETQVRTDEELDTLKEKWTAKGYIFQGVTEIKLPGLG